MSEVINYLVLIIIYKMGKKGAKGKGKPVVMTQAEFFTSTQASSGSSAIGGGGWENAGLFLGADQPKPKVVVAEKKQPEVDLLKTALQ
jgi:hypothetical protein